jgi:ketosteroid isomerase-like protein
MSQENVELILRAVAFTNAGDVEAALNLYHPDAELRDLQHPPDMPEVLHGRDTIMAAMRRWQEVLDEWRIELHEYVDVHPWVVGEVTWHAIGKGSSTPIEWRVAEACEVKDGKIIRVLAGFADLAAALKAVGLEA